ncbi:unnamed protein product [Caenorhabditis auriculariae]|uniref:Uncharacterized protein n=1 Tax=Caenorhabditis auriculariae TaxID=2777116 RepID=A0A8S1HG97_9PELO|nr:unnamed protein product [Caenorhabditis auriculariae]
MPRSQKGSLLVYDEFSYEYRLRRPKEEEPLVGARDIAVRCSKAGCRGTGRLKVNLVVVEVQPHDHLPPVGLQQKRRVMEQLKTYKREGESLETCAQNVLDALDAEVLGFMPQKDSIKRTILRASKRNC